jgi:hypothetical protein
MNVDRRLSLYIIEISLFFSTIYYCCELFTILNSSHQIFRSILYVYIMEEKKIIKKPMFVSNILNKRIQP